jgi:hypothetical protein
MKNAGPAPTRSAADFLPRSPAARHNLDSLRKAADDCKGCPLYQRATQTVFGEGKPHAKMILVGEQPGDREDIEGKPFVGPAGLLLDRCLEEAGIDRDEIYLTNAVKHFKWGPRGKRRIHKKRGLREIAACRPWFDAEVGAVRTGADRLPRRNCRAGSPRQCVSRHAESRQNSHRAEPAARPRHRAPVIDPARPRRPEPPRSPRLVRRRPAGSSYVPAPSPPRRIEKDKGRGVVPRPLHSSRSSGAPFLSPLLATGWERKALRACARTSPAASPTPRSRIAAAPHQSAVESY